MALPDRDNLDRSLWLLKLNENVSVRRGQMFRLLQLMSQVLVVGNAGGTALLFSVNPGPNPGGVSHWLIVAGVIIFGVGVITAAGGLALLAGIVVKEAHMAETTLHGYVKGELSEEETVRLIDPTAFTWARSAMVVGIFSSAAFTIGAVITLVLAVVYL